VALAKEFEPAAQTIRNWVAGIRNTSDRTRKVSPTTPPSSATWVRVALVMEPRTPLTC